MGKKSAGKSWENIKDPGGDKKKRKAKKKKKLIRKNSSVEKLDDEDLVPSPTPYEGPCYSDGEGCEFESFDCEGVDQELMQLFDETIDQLMRDERQQERRKK